jgi:hypothetical protein
LQPKGRKPATSSVLLPPIAASGKGQIMQG